MSFGIGTYKLINHAEGFTVDIVDWTYSERIHTGNARNSLKIEKTDNYFTYSINGEVVFIDYFSEL